MIQTEKDACISYYKEGLQFYKAATKPGKKRIFTPVLLYNLACMSIEKFFMAFFFFNKSMPDNHTMKDLVESAAKISDISGALKDNMLFLDGFQDICPVHAVNTVQPQEKDMLRTIETLDMVKDFVDGVLKITAEKTGAFYENNNT
ncbi:MAG: hypothetical protein JXR81_03630 [Candidatus Goldbacteria bacterium]|nr:hypothetical protein [Candidatus Goldiibacteriota bacterium]